MTQYDDLSRRCPMLGHEITFSYCRQPGQEIPCRKVLDCWWEKFDIQAYISQHFNDQILQNLQEPQKPKILSLLEIIEQSRQRASKSSAAD